MEKKQFLTYDEQICFLEQKKGLRISDKEYAKRILFKTGYFPLINGYKEVFKKSTTNQFQKGIRFEDIYERLLISKEKGRYKYGKNDLYAQVIILKLLLTDEDFRAFFHDLKLCFKKYPVHKVILGKMGFPENWERIGRIKKYTKQE